ncbi:MAG: hypothetical protein OES10_02055 [Gammaproteobacteria bacterium]|nr:hypothetical protein [Gammaproteobacteria bacterium]
MVRLTFKAAEIRALPLWGAVLPLLTINVCYLVAIGLEHLPACVPYLSGCTSVSSTGRLAPESLISKAGMLPGAVIAALFWWHCATFLEIGRQSRFRRMTIRVLGVTAALSLALYSLNLGLRGDEFRLLRRIGIDGFALSNFVAQIMFVVTYRHMRSDATQTLWRWLIALCVAMPAFAIALNLAEQAGVDRHTANNVAAWNAFVVNCAFYAVIYRLWQHHDFPGQSDNTSFGRAASPRV